WAEKPILRLCDVRSIASLSADLQFGKFRPNPSIQIVGDRFQVGRQNRVQVSGRPDTLLAVSYAEQLVQRWFESNLTAPPVVVVLLPLLSHEMPAVRDFATSSNNRYTGPFRDSKTTLFVDGPVAPLRHGKQRKSDLNLRCGAGVGRRRDLELKRP